MEMKMRIAFGTVLLLLASAGTALANDVYYPYETYDEYYKAHSVNPPPIPGKPLPPEQPPSQLKPLPASDQPVKLTEPPEFLFPPQLGFGVAVGIPYDLFYHSKTYYTVRGGTWYSAPSYKGPWTIAGLTRVPPELRKQSLAKIRKIRNEEFAKYWNNKARYQGKVFRPADEMPPPLKSEKTK